MRTTVDIQDSVLQAARAMARDEKISIGEAISRLALRGLAPRENAVSTNAKGFPIFRPDAGADAITLEIVNAHRDDR